MFVNTFLWIFHSKSSFQSNSFLFVQKLLVSLPPANQVLNFFSRYLNALSARKWEKSESLKVKKSEFVFLSFSLRLFKRAFSRKPIFNSLSKCTFSPLTNKVWPKMKCLFFSLKSRNKSLQINALILRFLSVRIMFVNTFLWIFHSK